MTRNTINQTPHELGYRMPAEWEKQDSVWLQWPGRHPAAGRKDDYSYQMKMEKTWMLICWEIHQQAAQYTRAQL